MVFIESFVIPAQAGIQKLIYPLDKGGWGIILNFSPFSKSSPPPYPRPLPPNRLMHKH